jgi:glycosyltransferase involved in cell wall biosynthesis
MEKLSATIITFNEEDNISGCIDSLRQVAEEIIVLDSFSSDRTVSVAISKGAIVKQAQFNGYIEQKNRSLSFCRYNYVLCLDADERIIEKLARSISAYEKIKDHRRRNEELSSIAARSLLASGKQIPWWKIILSPAWSFFHGYIVRLGFLDGYEGLVIALMSANQSFLKYNKQRILRQQEKTKIPTTTIFKTIE